MNPPGFNRVEPGAFDRQQVREQAQPHLQAVGLSSAEVQEHFICVVSPRAKTGHCLVALSAFWLPLHQTQFLPRFSPAMSLRLSKARKPAFILLHRQPVTPLFFTV